MKCKDWRIQISAFLDNALDETEREKTLRHIRECRECGKFHQEASDLSVLFTARLEGKEPSPFLWNKIERRITAANESKSRASFLEYLRLPRLAYGLASAMLLISLAALVQLRGPSVEDRELLAEMDAYELAYKGNPFLEKVEQKMQNPFLKHETGAVNPFDSTLRTNK